jgi:hypothetical protein
MPMPAQTRGSMYEHIALAGFATGYAAFCTAGPCREYFELLGGVVVERARQSLLFSGGPDDGFALLHSFGLTLRARPEHLHQVGETLLAGRVIT